MFEKYNKEFRDVLGVEYKNLPNNFYLILENSILKES